jgi:hypothetical protein
VESLDLAAGLGMVGSGVLDLDAEGLEFEFEGDLAAAGAAAVKSTARSADLSATMEPNAFETPGNTSAPELSFEMLIVTGVVLL